MKGIYYICVMKINGDITILVNQDGATIEIKDRDASTTFCKINMTSDEFCQSLSRLGHVKTDVNVYGIDRIGKKHENKSFEFKLPKGFKRIYGVEKQKLQDFNLSNIAQEELDKLNEGWIAESYFSGQGSFFTKDGEEYASVTIRRWI